MAKKKQDNIKQNKTKRQNNTQKKTKDRATRIHNKPTENTGAPEWLAVAAPHLKPVVLILF